MVEIVIGFLSLLLVCGVLLALGVDPRPHDPFLAVCGYLTAILLGIGLGAINVAIIGFFPGWLIGYALFSIIVYVTSGVIFMPSYLPDKVYYWLKFNPVLQICEWMRSAYYPSSTLEIDYLYVVMCSLACLAVGLFSLKTVVSKTAV
ncbi:hypothetical protein Q8W71_25520 [Methylobacterium sp. NEAU 140]|nr:hypothetical protein [Methylobacterium sp. NEAU 140]MDP4025997.1 hypothetical protein [Methylobacterium sp. NEAU 140]